MLVLTGSPRVADGGMTTTAQTIRVQPGHRRRGRRRQCEEHVLGSESAAGWRNARLLGPDPCSEPEYDGASFARRWQCTRGHARLWQNSNVVEAPTLQFDRDHRSLVAEGSSSQSVKTVLVQVEKNGKATPVVITSAHLTYNDAERKILLDGGVIAKGFGRHDDGPANDDISGSAQPGARRVKFRRIG